MQKYLTNNKGNSAIEFAIIFPLLLLVILAVIEFGAYFIKDQTAVNGLASISDQLRKNPTNPEIQRTAEDYGGAFLGFDQNPNYFCAQAYDNYDDALAGSCTNGWITARPATLDEDEVYYVAIAAQSEKFKIALSNFLPDIHREEVVVVGTPPVSPILANGDGAFPGKNSPNINFELKKAGVLNFTCSAYGTTGPHAVGGTDGWRVSVMVNGSQCATENSWSVLSSHASYYVSASCIRELAKGNHAIRCEADNYGDALRTVAGGGRYGYMVIAK